MDKYYGIKKAKVKVRRNEYKSSDSYRPKILWRYIAAAFLILGVAFCTKFTSYDASSLFKQDYIEQYAEG